MTKKPTIKKANLRFRSRLAPINKSRIKYIVDHHMAHESWNVVDVHNYHINGNGWNGIGYNWWIGFDGTIYEGRGWNIGAHVGGYNSISVGIGFQGHFDRQKMTEAQIKSGQALHAWLLDELNLSPSRIIGHRDLASTSCPGKNFKLGEVRKKPMTGYQAPPFQEPDPDDLPTVRSFAKYPRLVQITKDTKAYNYSNLYDYNRTLKKGYEVKVYGETYGSWAGGGGVYFSKKHTKELNQTVVTGGLTRSNVDEMESYIRSNNLKASINFKGTGKNPHVRVTIKGDDYEQFCKWLDSNDWWFKVE